MSDLIYIIIGGLLILVPVFNQTIKEINKPKEITHIRHYNEKDELIRYYINRDGNIEIKKDVKISNVVEKVYAAYANGEKISDSHAFTRFENGYLVAYMPYSGKYNISLNGHHLTSPDRKFSTGERFVVEADRIKRSTLIIERKDDANE